MNNRLFAAEVFIRVVEEGSFTAAAQRLGVTKSYASKIVARLEERLGARLLHRSTRQLVLTGPGRAYFERCGEVMRAMEQAEDEAAQLQGTPTGTLRLTLPTAFGVAHLIGGMSVGSISLNPTIGLDSVLLASLFSIGVGLFFGAYPANRAAGLNPIEALRYE